MWRGVVAAALVIGCRGDPTPKPRDPPAPTTPQRTVVPKLPQSPDGAQELVALDLQIAHAREVGDPEALITALSRRVMLRGGHADLREAFDRSQAWVSADAKNPRAQAVRVAILIQTHQFFEAEVQLTELASVAHDASEWEPPTATLAEATGKPELAQPVRERIAEQHPTAANLTTLAANLAMRGQVVAAIAMIPRAAAALRDPSPVLVSWLLVQWARLYVENDEPAAARQLLEEAHRRMPGYVEATVQLATAIRITGGDPRELVTAALAAEPGHPELLALAGKTAEARAAWVLYLESPMAMAYADHAARFYLGPGADPRQALELAEQNFRNRQTADARALVVEASLANAQADLACQRAEPLSAGTRAHKFLAWRAFTACGQTADADRLAQVLGIR